MKTPASFRKFGLAALLCIGSLQAAIAAAPTYRQTANVPLGQPDRWDYVHFDPILREVFVAHGSEITVVSADHHPHIVGQVQGIDGAHGVATDPVLGVGFADDGKAGRLSVFDLKTFKVIDSIPTDKDSDAVAYLAPTRTVLVANGDGHSLSLIDAVARRRVANVPLGGNPEGVVAEMPGYAFVNLADRREVVRVDLRKQSVDARWPVAECVSPHGLAIDPTTQRLFTSCKNGKLVVLSARSGRIVAVVPIGMGTDTAAFDPNRHLIFSSNGDGTLSVIAERSADHFNLLANVPTAVGARTMAENPASGRVFLVTATLESSKNGNETAQNGKLRFEPGTVRLIALTLVR
ncbi:MAG: hypothetical protein B7X31_14075 [Thiomonas sp. 13-66-29]|jgi:YVTN family beta-propeller protein|nr:MAG: hypothetical protein B7X31_14075 [Thiomonas sp. 13-66-29]